VTPLSVVNDTGARVTLVLDAWMMKQDIVNVHPLTNDATTALAPADLLRFVQATGHEPVIVELD
jgi:Ala-tRNA(Pro) deacylase